MLPFERTSGYRPSQSFAQKQAAAPAPAPAALSPEEQAWQSDPTGQAMEQRMPSQGLKDKYKADWMSRHGYTWGSVPPSAPAAVAPAPAPAAVAAGDDPTQMIRQQTARTMELLRQQMLRNQNYGVSRLRANLAQRGLMDSGSLGAGIGRITRDTGDVLSQGSMLAANNETDNLLKLLEAEKQRQFAAQQAEAERQALMQRMFEQGKMDRANRPSGWEQLLGGAASGLGQALPFLLAA